MHQRSPLIGQAFPGVKDACRKAVQAHAGLGEKWLVAVGWDCMIQAASFLMAWRVPHAGV